MRALDWIEEDQLAGGRYPQGDAAWADLARQGISVLITLHPRPHDPAALAHSGLTEKAMRADTRYPIHITFSNGRWMILDGYHRLLKTL
jgi:hypothetical protein